MPYFLLTTCPKVTIVDQDEQIDLNARYADTFEANASRQDFRVGEHSFAIRGFRLHHPTDSHHKLIYAANQRGVVSERLERHFANLQKRLSSNGEAFYYLGFVEGV